MTNPKDTLSTPLGVEFPSRSSHHSNTLFGEVSRLRQSVGKSPDLRTLFDEVALVGKCRKGTRYILRLLFVTQHLRKIDGDEVIA